MDKVRTLEEVMALIDDGAVLMIGGFMSNGTPEILMDGIVAKGIKNLTVIANDTGTVGTGIGKLIEKKLVKKVITSHIGLNPETGRQLNAKEIEVELVPQGTLAEQIRAAGAGLGGVLTKTGLGTIVEEGKKIINVDGEDYLLEKPIKADIALVRGSIVDKSGNIYYHNSTQNFNPLIAMAAKTVIVAAEKIVEVGELDPNHVMTPGIFVDYIVGGEK